jgi:hypothetical protein
VEERPAPLKITRVRTPGNSDRAPSAIQLPGN